MTRSVSVAELVRRASDPGGSMRSRHAAFATLVERFEEMALAIALDACDDDLEAARDACQEAFLLAWRKLPGLREPAAFGGWLKRLVRTRCAKLRRRRMASAELAVALRRHDARERGANDVSELAVRREIAGLVRRAVVNLSLEERRAIVLFYFLGEPLRAIAAALGVSPGTAGKRVFAGRLHLRRALPRSVTASLLATGPTLSFTRRVRNGIYDEFVGEYRFRGQPHRRVRVAREGESLVGHGGGQRHVLASRRPDTLVPAEFDGEARFHRDARGRISHLVYYEFGRRLGVADRVGRSRAMR